jgi:hypothetical protein
MYTICCTLNCPYENYESLIGDSSKAQVISEQHKSKLNVPSNFNNNMTIQCNSFGISKIKTVDSNTNIFIMMIIIFWEMTPCGSYKN